MHAEVGNDQLKPYAEQDDGTLLYLVLLHASTIAVVCDAACLWGTGLFELP